MTSTTVLRTPPASSSRPNDRVPMRLSRGSKEKDMRREHSPSPVAFIAASRATPSAGSPLGDSPSHQSPSPLRKRVLFRRNDSDHSESEGDELSPSLYRRRSPFASRCASPFLGAWVNRSPRPQVAQPVEDDEGYFLTSTTTTSSSSVLGCPNLTLDTESPSFAANFLTPHQKQPFIALSPLPASRPRLPQTPAETEWHLGRQAESMTKLSLGDDGGRKVKGRVIATRKEAESSPSPITRHRGRKRSFDGNELPRAKGELFETFADTPVATSFRLPETPSPAAKLRCSATAFFGPSIRPSPHSSLKPPQLTVTTAPRSQELSPKSSTEPIAKKYKPRDSGIGGINTDESEDNLSPLSTKSDGWLQNTDEDISGLITPGLDPIPRSVWPSEDPENVDDFIIRTLAAGGAPPRDKKVMPGTPQKRTAYSHLRPWMSSSKALEPSAAPRMGGAPRKSLPLSFPNLSKLHDSPDSETSPSDRTLSLKKSYSGLGRGRPTILLPRDSKTPHNSKIHALMRRSSSGAFSSSSSEGSCLGTPTKLGVPEFGLSVTQPRPYKLSPRPSFNTLPRVSNEYERPGKFEADFVTIDTLGVGVFGSALKVLYKQGNENNVSAIKKSKRLEGVKHRRRLREETDVLQHLAKIAGPAGHSNVLQYIDSWEQDDILYIHTELCELGNFATFLSEYGTHFEALDEARVWKVCAELSNGLKFIHDSGVIHLDLKPANIFVSGDGRFKIGDFGMASLWPRQSDDGGFEREGDREYMAPEILRGLYGPAADIFSLGMIILEAATNIVVPNMGDDWHKLREDDFSAVDFVGTGCLTRSTQLIRLMSNMMHSQPHTRLTVSQVYEHPVVKRARHAMDQKRAVAIAHGQAVFGASPLGGEPDTYLADILQVGHFSMMDETP